MSAVPAPFEAAEALVGVGPGPTPTERRERLRSLLSEGNLMLPGAYDALSARLIETAGFDAVYLTGAGYANSGLGVPDIGLVTGATEMRDHVARIADVVDGSRWSSTPTRASGTRSNIGRTCASSSGPAHQRCRSRTRCSRRSAGTSTARTVIPAQEMVQKKVRAAVENARRAPSRS